MEAVKQNGWALEYASEELKRDREVVMEAVKQEGTALQYASEELRGDREVVLEAVKQDGWALQYAGSLLLYEVAECWKDAIERDKKNDK
jgi:hypothetical protein